MQSCSCEECKSACRNDPGRLIPADMEKIAAHLGVSVHDLASEYLVKIPSLKDASVCALAPAKMKGKRFVLEPGGTAPAYYAEERGSCIFLDARGLCSIHAVKPFECSAYMGCRNTFLGKPYRDSDVEEYFHGRWKRTNSY